MEFSETKAFTMYKKCNHCGRELPLDNFYKSTKTSDGLQGTCKECHKEASRKSYAKRKTENSTVDKVVSECGLYKVYAHPELASFSTRKLLEELKARGYTWEKMFAPRQEIDYRKI